MRLHLDGAHAHPLDRMQHRVERGRLHRDRVTRFCHRLQAQIDRFRRADGHDDLVRVDRLAVLQITPRDLPDQFRIARRQLVRCPAGRIATRSRIAVGIDLLDREQRRIGIGRAQRYRIVAANRAQRGEDETADVHLCRHGNRLRRPQFARSGRARQAARLHEIARLRAALDHALAFKQEVGVQHRLDAQTMLLTGLPDRWNALAGKEDATTHLIFDSASQRLIQLHGLHVRLGLFGVPGVQHGRNSISVGDTSRAASWRAKTVIYHRI
jgi:hypothetical protein